MNLLPELTNFTGKAHKAIATYVTTISKASQIMLMLN